MIRISFKFGRRRQFNLFQIYSHQNRKFNWTALQQSRNMSRLIACAAHQYFMTKRQLNPKTCSKTPAFGKKRQNTI